MSIFRIGEKGISYWARSKDISKGRDTVLFIHGAGGSQFSWSFQKGFFEREFNPIIIELPGHGESGGQGEEEIKKYAEHVSSFLKGLDLERLFLVGHSMGGAIVQTLALTHPEVVQGMVLVGTGAKLRVYPAILEGIKNHFEETIRSIVQYAYSRKAPPELIERGIEHLAACRPQVLYGDFLACDRFDLMTEVGRIDLPTLIICGSDDEMTPVRYSEYLYHHIGQSKMEIVRDAGHMVMMESPDVFNQTVSEFIRGI